MTGIIPIEWLWYIIGAVSVPAFILIYLKALKRNRADKHRASMRRKRFERMMKARGANKSSKRANSDVDRAPVGNTGDAHWLRGVKLPVKRTESQHWLETLKPKRRRHWLENLRRH